MIKLYHCLQLIFISCIGNFVECRTIRAADELLKTSTGNIQSCNIGEFESFFGAQFQVIGDSNVTILIDINYDHPSFNGSPILRYYRDDEELEFLFPSGFSEFPIEAPLVFNSEPGNSNIFIVYEFGLFPVALKLRSFQSTNNGEYRIEIGTSSTPVLATSSSGLQLITSCGGDSNSPVIKKESSEDVFEEVGSYERKFGGRVYLQTGTSISLKIVFDERHPKLEGETPQVTLYKDGVELRSQFGFISEGEFPLEPELQAKYPNIFISYDFGFVFNSLIIKNGNSQYTGEYTLTISTQSRFGIDNATTFVWFSGSIDPPSLKRGEEKIIVYSERALNYTGLVGSSFVVLGSWNEIGIIAEDSNNSQDNVWVWYFTPNNGMRRRIEQSSSYKITEDRNSSTLLIQDCNALLFGRYTVEVSNSIGSDSESTEINRIRIPMVKFDQSTTSDDVIRIGKHVDLGQLSDLDNQTIVIEARDRTGFPSSRTDWFFSEWKYGIREQIENSENFQIFSTPDSTRLVIRNATKVGFGYYFAVASNMAGVDETCTILGQSPSLVPTWQFHSVRGFLKGHIGDSFIVKGNSQISIEANATGFPPVSFTWFEGTNPLQIYSYARKIEPSSTLMIGNTLNKSILTQLVPFKNLITKYIVIVKNQLGKTREDSYAVWSEN